MLDKEGRVTVDLAMIIRPAGTLAGHRVDSCPVATMRASWLLRALEAVRLSDIGERIADIFTAPTQAAYDAVQIVAAERRAKELHEIKESQ